MARESPAARARRREAMSHANTLGAGAKKREHMPAGEKMHTVMSEFKRGTLHSGSGDIVTSRKQAIAIGLSEERRHGNPVPKKRRKR